MTHYLEALGSAVYSRLNGQATVSIYDTLAPPGSVPPYGIWQLQAAVDTYMFADAGEFLAADVVVKVVSNHHWATEATRIYDHIHNAMQDAPLAVTGYNLIRCRRASLIRFRDPDEYWHVGGLYTVEIDS